MVVAIVDRRSAKFGNTAQSVQMPRRQSQLTRSFDVSNGMPMK
jgi:hypothetical protein